MKDYDGIMAINFNNNNIYIAT